jgi:hypothetical protein
MLSVPEIQEAGSWHWKDRKRLDDGEQSRKAVGEGGEARKEKQNPTRMRKDEGDAASRSVDSR